MKNNERGRWWNCKTCGSESAGRLVPRGWYGIQRYPGDEEENNRPANIGIFCSAACMSAAMPQIEQKELDFGDRFRYFPRDNRSRS